MKRVWWWVVTLLALAAGALVLAYQQRNFAGMLIGLSLVLVAVSVSCKPLRNTLTVMVSLVLALALAEFALGFQQEDLLQVQMDANYWSRSDLGSSPSPGRHHARKATTAGEVIYDVDYMIGADGFRVTPGANSSSPMRVNLFGCSFMFGEGLSDNETLPAYLSKQLPDAQVKNFGIHGYGMHQALAIMESQRDTTGKVNFVLTAPWHAERSACVPSYALGSPRFRLLADGKVERDGVCGGISYYPLARVLSLSRVYNLVKRAMESRQGQDPQIELYLALLRRIAELSEGRHQQLVIGFVKAEENWFKGTYSNEKIFQRLKAMNIELIDVTLADKAEDIAELYLLNKLDGHPSAAANDARAKLVAGTIKTGLDK